MDGPVGASAIVPASHHPCMDIIVHTPATDVDRAPTPVAVQMQSAFWTSCEECGLRLEYPMIYQHCLLRCPHCHKPFEAIEKSLKSIIGQNDSSVPQAPNDEVAVKCVEALPCKKNSRRVPRKFQHESGHGVSIIRGDLLGSIMQARHKTRRNDLNEPSSSHYKVSNYTSFAIPFVPPAIHKKASPEDVIAELKTIPDLAPMDWLRACNMLRYDNFQFRSLKALPMDMRKEWLLNEMK
ncbi:hypothetical protein PAHAL_6G170700 [Panicum hallii]|uniref:Zinc beta-ribbon domain-containing protein n=1 Tax=Panicum hallii TaxID=206008 RepID=A0A2S3I1S2_9POAL|nr:hypothetical protein PAHAL_6G170700 [Panicum hallii]